uniref:Uncharacterized protein n=1 Tax=Fagus sylvatica TaxID=28930 RepID=A0A2N9H000_FAGSY
MDNSQNTSYQAGQVKGQTQAGQQVKAKAQGAADVVKDAVGAKK